MEQILIVDDSMLSCKMLSGILNRGDRSVMTANSAEDLFRSLGYMTPDLILLDLVLPDMSGYEVCTELKKRVQTRNVPIVFITSSSDEASILQGFEAGATDYISKPFLPAVLKARVDCHLQNKLMADKLRVTNHRLEKTMEELRLQAYKDSLTNLYNRRFFLEETVQWKKWVEGTKGAHLFLIDVDHFKGINDTYGHCTGDYVLYTVADLLSQSLEDQGTACRWGGDEFLLMVCDMSEEAVLSFAETIRGEIADYPFNYDGQPLRCSCTIGVAPFAPELSVEENVTRADQALYRGKELGRNCCAHNMNF